MKYGYYPGCSLERNAYSYHQSTLAVAKPLGLEFVEVEDWNCCGATEYFAIDAIPAYALVGRNLALAAQQKGDDKQLVAPCSACFLNLKKTDHYMDESPELAEKVNTALAAGELHYEPGSVEARHLLDVIVSDVGYDAVAEKVTKPLYNLKVASYYGCMIVRPRALETFDDAECPTSMDHLMEVLGAEAVDFSMKAHCCGGHMTQISEPTAFDLIRSILKNAVDNGADTIVTLCPMCQLNLDAYQSAVNKHFGTDYNIPILYFTQLMGLAFGIPAEELGIGKELVDARSALTKIGTEAPPKPKKKRPSKKALPMPSLLEEA
ncbi:MAG: CoB--CoM heterodisulfide reductase iron-sulfur subunit B family protein [Chloroflexota bacterium]|nr:CoB--CoM heterodisulfide reductase iron-sulfur subunit B family protein [Chloroflexota bacterium]